MRQGHAVDPGCETVCRRHRCLCTHFLTRPTDPPRFPRNIRPRPISIGRMRPISPENGKSCLFRRQDDTLVPAVVVVLSDRGDVPFPELLQRPIVRRQVLPPHHTSAAVRMSMRQHLQSRQMSGRVRWTMQQIPPSSGSSRRKGHASGHCSKTRRSGHRPYGCSTPRT